MILSHSIALDLTCKQQAFIRKACGAARYTWNWAVERCRLSYAAGEKLNIPELKKRWNTEKPAWVKESPKDANQQPFAYLQRAYTAGFERIKQGKEAGFPRFHKRGRRDSFYLSNDKIKVEGKQLRMPLLGWVRMREALRFEGKVMSCTVSIRAGRYFAAIQVELPDEDPIKCISSSVGVDLGCKDAAVLSTGEKFKGPRPLKKHLRRLARLQRSVSRQCKGSARRKERLFKISKLHCRVSNIRKDFQHKLTSKICKENQLVTVEDLNVAGLVKNHRLSRAILDVGFAEIRRQVEYKQRRLGHHVYVVDRFFPSSKTCNACGHKKDKLALSERVFRCEGCGAVEDRDINAAKNLNTRGLREIYAQGQVTLTKNLVELRTKPNALVRTN